MRRIHFTVFSLAVLAILTAPVAFAQFSTLGAQAELRGQVFLSNNVPATTGVMVMLDRRDSGLAGSTQTDSRGKFEFRSLTPMPYTLRVRVKGYEPYEETFDLTLNTHAYAVIHLKPQPGTNAEAAAPAAGEVNVRDAAIPAGAVKEFDQGKKLLLEKKDAAGSAEHLRKAIKQYENFPQAYVLLGVALQAQQKLPEAEEAYAHASQLDPKMADAFLALGTLQNQQKKFADAEHALTRAVELKPDSFQAQYELGKSCWAQQRNEQAEAHATKAVALQPNSAEAHLLMGNVLLRKHDNQGALREFKDSLKADPKNPYATATQQMIDKLEAAPKAQ